MALARLLLFVAILVGIALGMSFLWNSSRTAGPVREPEAPVPTTTATERNWPRSIAAIGDSITQAANVGYGSGDSALMHSWATGRDTEDPVLSHWERLVAVNGSADVVAYNDSVSGSRMRDAPLQAQLVVSQNVEYITFLMGANDACASNPSAMTSVSSFRRDFRQAIDILLRGLPDALVYVVSIPDVYRLWDVMNDHPGARQTWRAFGTCGALLAEDNRDRDRHRVQDRVERYNEVLEEVCTRHERCRHDGGAVFRYRFTPEDVSPLDFFHPSITGQSHLAEVTWRHGPFGRSDGTSPGGGLHSTPSPQ